MNHGVPTTYAGTRFRSRLEARWGRFFDAIGWRWEYEPFDGGGYIPDFVIQGPRPLLVEVKPVTSVGEAARHYRKVSLGVPNWNHDIIIVGVCPDLMHEEEPYGGEAPFAGYMGEPVTEETEWGPIGVRDWGAGRWFHCGECGRLAILHDTGGWMGRPCGHYDGDGLVLPVERTGILTTWASARNMTQWSA